MAVSWSNGTYYLKNSVWQYFAYGIDRKGVHIHDYVFEYEFMRTKRAQIAARGETLHYAFLHKPACTAFLSSLGLPVSQNLGYISNGLLFIQSIDHKANTERDIITYATSHDVSWFVKPVGLCCGRGAFSLKSVRGNISIDGNLLTDKRSLPIDIQNTYIVETYIEQCSEAAAVYSNSVNTLRIVTVLKEKKIDIYEVIWRIGCEGKSVDNFSSGGIVLGVDKEGRCKKYGFREIKWGHIYEKHPDTKVRFEGMHVPFFKEACTLAMKGHGLTHGGSIIAWDIALTTNGPIIVECNEGTFNSTDMGQIVNGPGRDKFEYYHGQYTP